MNLIAQLGEPGSSRRKLIIGGGIVLAVLTLGFCAGPTSGSEPSCASLIPDVIEMSEDRDVKILEISSPEALWGGEGELHCKGHAIWSDGDEGSISYEVSTSPGGRQMLGYRGG